MLSGCCRGSRRLQLEQLHIIAVAVAVVIWIAITCFPPLHQQADNSQERDQSCTGRPNDERAQTGLRRANGRGGGWGFLWGLGSVPSGPW